MPGLRPSNIPQRLLKISTRPFCQRSGNVSRIEGRNGFDGWQAHALHQSKLLDAFGRFLRRIGFEDSVLEIDLHKLIQILKLEVVGV